MLYMSDIWFGLYMALPDAQKAMVLVRLRDDMGAAVVAFGEMALVATIEANVDSKGKVNLGNAPIEMGIADIFWAIRRMRAYHAHAGEPDYELLMREQIEHRW